MMEAGAYPSPLNYYNFPKSVCTSVNEVRTPRRALPASVPRHRSKAAAEPPQCCKLHAS